MSMWMSDSRTCTTPTQITPLTHTLSSVLSLRLVLRTIGLFWWIFGCGFVRCSCLLFFSFSLPYLMVVYLSPSLTLSVYSHLPRAVRCLFTIDH